MVVNPNSAAKDSWVTLNVTVTNLSNQTRSSSDDLKFYVVLASGELVSDDYFGQVLVTDTDKERLDQILGEAVPDRKVFEVSEGTIREVEMQKMEL